MAWLNLNNSINSLKGQITNLATDLLSEGIIQSSDIDDTTILQSDSRLQELENVVCTQKIEIETLQRQNEELAKKLCKNNELQQQFQLQENESQSHVVNTNTKQDLQFGDEWTMFDDFDIDNVNDNNYVTTTLISASDDDNNVMISGDNDHQTQQQLLDIEAEINKNNKIIDQLSCEMLKSRVDHMNSTETYQRIYQLQKLNDQLLQKKCTITNKQLDLCKRKCQQLEEQLMGGSNQDANNKKMMEELQQENKKLHEMGAHFDEMCEQNKKLKLENETLMADLNQLDQDCQQTTDKLVTLRDTLQQDFNRIQLDYDQLAAKNVQLQQMLQQQQAITMDNNHLLNQNQQLQLTIQQLQQQQQQQQQPESEPADDVSTNSTQTQTTDDDDNKLDYEKELAETRTKLESTLQTSLQYQNQLNNIYTILNHQLNTQFKVVVGGEEEEGGGSSSVAVENVQFTNELNTKLMELINQSTESVPAAPAPAEVDESTTSEEEEIDELTRKLKESNDELKRIKNDLDFYKSECDQLRKNNENLFEDMKLLNESANLETIVETNEDYLLKLETQLDDAKQQINQLQHSNQLGSESMEAKQNSIEMLQEKLQTMKLNETQIKLQLDTLKRDLDTTMDLKLKMDRELQQLRQHHAQSQETLSTLTMENDGFKLKLNIEKCDRECQSENHDHDHDHETIRTLKQDYQKLKNDFDELMKVINLKHNENVAYHTEIQRLNTIIIDEQQKYDQLLTKMETTTTTTTTATAQVQAQAQVDQQQLLHKYEQISDQNTFLQEKCDILTRNLLEEQSQLHNLQLSHQSTVDTITTLRKELDRLREHLLHVEDAHAQEMLDNEHKRRELTAQIMEMEQRERDNSTIYTSVSIRANQQVETLQKQIQLANQQRDEYQQRLSESDDKQLKQLAALTNLQCVLEQFQKDKEKEIEEATLIIRKELQEQQNIKEMLHHEMDVLRTQLNESKQGLKAASRLQEQLEKARHQVCTYKDEVEKLNTKLTTMEQLSNELTTQSETKVDKTLVKNLFMGYMTTSNNPQYHKDVQKIVKIIGTVLDFSQIDYEKVLGEAGAGGLLGGGTTGGSSWYQSILKPSYAAADQHPHQSLSEAFVKFLENESRPKPIKPPLLLVNPNSRKNSTDVDPNQQTTSTSSAASVSGATTPPSSAAAVSSSLLLNDVLLPTFEDFAHTRSSSSILKDVLNNK